MKPLVQATKHAKLHLYVHYALILLGSLCLLYYTYLSLRYGINYIVFSWLFLLVGGFCILVVFIEKRKKICIFAYIPRILRYCILSLLVIGMSIFLVVEARIIATGQTTSSSQANTLIVLGAQLNGTEVSRLLRYRLEAALAFHEQYPDATIIVSGGQGAGEDQSEASAMKKYLVSHGVREDLIFMEEESRNTAENFTFSKVLLKNDTQVSVITNDFHMYRAAYLCKESGLTCSLYPARSDFDLAPNFYVREFFGVIKDQVLTKLK